MGEIHEAVYWKLFPEFMQELAYLLSSEINPLHEIFDI